MLHTQTYCVTNVTGRDDRKGSICSTVASHTIITMRHVVIYFMYLLEIPRFQYFVNLFEKKTFEI